jgi:hypothetical protein
MKKNKKVVLKGAGVLLCAAMLLLSTGLVTANTNETQAAVSLSGETITINNAPSTTRSVLYDNGLPNGVNGLSNGVWETYDREVVDDFITTTTWIVTGGEFRIVTFGGATSIPGVIVNFYQDLGDIPSTTAFATKTADIICTATGNTYFSRPEILVTCTFETVTLEPGKWWVGFHPQAEENVFWLTANMSMHHVYVSYPDLGYPKWTDGNVVWPDTNHDVSWLITGTSLDIEITILGGFGVSAKIKNNGATALTDVPWTIDLEGGLILVGKTKTGTIENLPAGEEVTVKSIVLGFGKPTITVTAAADTMKNATATVLLFFVLGVA